MNEPIPTLSSRAGSRLVDDRGDPAPIGEPSRPQKRLYGYMACTEVNVDNAIGPQGLAGSVFPSDLSFAMHVAERLEIGVVHIRSQATFIERYVPFGWAPPFGMRWP